MFFSKKKFEDFFYNFEETSGLTRNFFQFFSLSEKNEKIIQMFEKFDKPPRF